VQPKLKALALELLALGRGRLRRRVREATAEEGGRSEAEAARHPEESALASSSPPGVCGRKACPAVCRVPLRDSEPASRSAARRSASGGIRSVAGVSYFGEGI